MLAGSCRFEGEDLLTLYQWNTRRAKRYFCCRCGIYVFHRKRAAPGHFGINVFCRNTSISRQYPCAQPRALI